MKRSKKGYEAYCDTGAGLESTEVLRSLRAAQHIARSMANRTGRRACVIRHSGINYKQRVLRWYDPSARLEEFAA